MISEQRISFALQLLNHIYVAADANCAVIGVGLHSLFPRVQREAGDLEVERIQRVDSFVCFVCHQQGDCAVKVFLVSHVHLIVNCTPHCTI